MSQEFSIIPGVLGELARREVYRLTLDKCASDCLIGFGTIFSHKECGIEENVFVGLNCMIGKVHIGKNVLIGSHVDLLSGKYQHSFDLFGVEIRNQKGEFKRISIGDGSWIGNHCVIMANIGRRCIVGAGSVVVEPIEDDSIAVGNPARVIKKREKILEK